MFTDWVTRKPREGAVKKSYFLLTLPGFPCYICDMTPMDFKTLSQIGISLSQAGEVAAGVRSGSLMFTVSFLTGWDVDVTAREMPDLSGSVREPGVFLDKLRKAVGRYVVDCGRFHYLRRPYNVLEGTGSRFVPGSLYRVVLWVDDTGTGYDFSFMPLRSVTRESAGSIPAGAYTVKWDEV